MATAIKITPKNLIGDFGYCESWSLGTSVAPDGWTMTGTAGSVAREGTIVKFGSYSMKITSGSSSTYSAEYSFSDYSSYKGRTMTFGAYIYCGTADKARISIYDGVSTSNSSYHTGSSTWEYVSVTAKIDSSATEITLSCEVASTSIAAYFDGGIFVEGETAYIDLSGEIEDWKPATKITLSKFELARRDETYIDMESVVSREKSISITGNIYKSTAALARSEYDTILQNLFPGEKWLYLFDDRYIPAVLSSENATYKAALKYLKFSLTFTAPGSFNYYISRLRDTEVISSTPTSFNFSYAGGIFTRPKITFSADQGGDISSCVLQNLTSGEQVSFSDTVSSGNDLVIDCDEQTVKNNGVDSIAYFAGDFLKLVPGTNYFVFTGSDCTIKIDYYKRWLS